MSLNKELLMVETDETLSFGDYTLEQKAKIEDFEFKGDIYKVKTFKEITKLEKNGMFAYESVPGTRVEHYQANEELVTFEVMGDQDTQIIIGLESDTEYVVYMDKVNVGDVITNLSGKLALSAELGAGKNILIEVVKK
ncbi:MAG TPA: endosialidase [Candidatus Dorea intestinavium]|nr:endosialidase [Candidatus Dorea intestinavium]